MSLPHMFVEKHVSQLNFLERVLNFLYHVFGIYNSFSNPCTSETIYCHFLLRCVDSLYDYKYSGLNNEESSDEEEAAIVIETNQSKPVSHSATDQSKLVSYTDSSSEEE